MQRLKFIFATTILLVLAACGGKNQQQSNNDNNNTQSVELRHAKGFKIEDFDNYRLVTVFNPWQKGAVMETYVLVDRNSPMPENLPQGMVVRVPIERAALCSSIFVGEYRQLESLDKIVAVSEPEYIDVPYVKDGLKNGSIVDIGQAVRIDTEKLLKAKVDIMVVSPFEASMHDRLKENGIVVVKDASYMEETPLGRAEWLKFEACFLGKDEQAAEIFDGIEERYNALLEKVATTTTRPRMFAEKKFGDVWYVSGGNSYMGNFYKDAGANYIWSDLTHSGSMPYSFEQVFAKAVDADFWLLKYNQKQGNMTLKQLGNEYVLYKKFKAYENGNVFGINSGISPYYEEGPMEPDVVLADLVSIFHPELLPNHKAKYYFRLE